MAETEYYLHKRVLYFNVSIYVYVYYKLVIDTNFDTLKIHLFKSPFFLYSSPLWKISYNL